MNSTKNRAAAMLKILTKCALLILLFALSSAAAGPVGPRLILFPQPNVVQQEPGEYRLSGLQTVNTDPQCRAEAKLLAALLGKATGQSHCEAKADDTGVSARIDGSLTELGAEGYTLDVTSDQIRLRAMRPAGIFYAIQTLRQMLPEQIETASPDQHVRWSIPCVHIVDKPRFVWRGMLLDVSRHFFPVEDVERLLDLMALHKMNTFHWHLCDDGGWRLEIKKYPQLTSVGAWRQVTATNWEQGHLSFPGPNTTKSLYGGFYTQEDVKRIIRYAEARHIRVVPEIEMPGHSLAALAAYPELACKNPPLSDFQKKMDLPAPNVLCAGKEEAFNFIEGVLDEVVDLFPSRYVHVGGDEVEKMLWEHCPDCQARMQSQHLANAQELQSYFMKRIARYLQAKGKTLLGWDEILQGGLPPNSIVMAWHDSDLALAAAAAGHDVVLSPTSSCYLNYSYKQNPTENVCAYDPIPPALKEQARHVLGVQANLWTEWIPDLKTAEQQLFPRLVALAEIGWSTRRDPDAGSFARRLAHYYSRLEALNVHFYIPRPEPQFDAVFLDKGVAMVAFKKPALEDCTLRYTTDGSLPDASSPIYTGPLQVSSPMTVTATVFRNHGGQSDPARCRVAATPDVAMSDHWLGLDYKVAKGDFSMLPEFSKLSATSTGRVASIELPPGSNFRCAVEYDGYLRIQKEGTYTLSISSDDGSVLWLAGAKLIDNNGLHGPIEASGRVHLKPGDYPLRVGYFQAAGGQSLSASIQSETTAKQPLPADMLYGSAN
jgi:hexosaminidase